MARRRRTVEEIITKLREAVTGRPWKLWGRLESPMAIGACLRCSKTGRTVTRPPPIPG
jgi:hypothetical protein